MAGGGLTLARYIGPCWRGVAAGAEADVLSGSERAGRYNRPGARTLYMSGSPAGVAAAMARYGDAPRATIRVQVRASALLDLRDAAACARLGIDPRRATEDWMAELVRGEEPAAWHVAAAARAAGAIGLIDPSRHAPDRWHLVLFAWNDGNGASVTL